MSTRDWYITQGNTAPEMPGQLKQPDGTAVNLTGATVRLRMRRVDGTTETVSNAVITNAIDGRVRYDWQSSDTTNFGTYFAKWEVTLSNGKTSSYPNFRSLLIEVTPRV